MRTAFIPCSLLCLAAACASSARISPKPRADAAPTEATASVNPTGDARVDALGEELSQEQQRNAALQEQLDARGQEVEQLRTEVQQLRDEGSVSGGAPAPPATAAAAGEATAPAEPALPPASAPAQPPLPAVEATEAAPQPPTGPDNDVGNLMSPALTPATESGNSTSSGTAESGVANASPAPAEFIVASLREALSQEHQRREAAEAQLARLKEETSAPPYGHDRISAADFAAAKQEIVELRRMLDDERAEREHLAQALRSLQQRAALDGAPAAAAAQDDGTPSRLQRLQVERDATMDHLKQSLEASQHRVVELETQLTATRDGTVGAARSDSSPDGDLASMRAENAALRTQLDEEHRQTEELARKLKVASRVTDLIFKMQAQQAAPSSAAAPAMEMR